MKDVNFTRLKEIFWGESGHRRGFKGSQEKICPRDGILGCAIVDALEADLTARATHFVSWCWQYSVGAVLSALGLWSKQERLDGADVFFWLCFFCNNQRQILMDQTSLPSDDLQNVFARRLRSVGRMVILLDD